MRDGISYIFNRRVEFLAGRRSRLACYRPARLGAAGTQQGGSEVFDTTHLPHWLFLYGTAIAYLAIGIVVFVRGRR